jgi:U4/U6.U5 tri-snRNP component SNU23
VTKTGVGWHCKVCDCFLKDSNTYLDHINGKKHQRNLGYSMRVERSTKYQLSSRLDQLVKEKEKSKMDAEFLDPAAETNYEDIVKTKDEEAKIRKEERARQRKERKKRSHQETPAEVQEAEEEEEEAVEEAEGIDPAMAAMMGFSGFGGGKK